MAKYGTFKYGTQKYGSSSISDLKPRMFTTGYYQPMVSINKIRPRIIHGV